VNLLVWHWGRRGAGPLYSLKMAEALTHLMPGNVLLSYSRQSDYLEDFRELEGPRLEVDTFSTTVEGIRKTVRLPQLGHQFARFIAENRVDAVYCPMWHPWNAAMVGTLKKKRIPFILTVHDAIRHEGDAGPFQRWVERYEQRHADAFIALSEHVKRQLDSRRHRPRFGTTLIPLPNFSYATQDRASSSSSETLKCLFIGRIRPYKGIGVLLDAFGQITRESEHDVVLTIAGSGDLQPYESKLSRLAGLNVQNKWLSDSEFGQLIHSHDVLILPYLEASQSGVIAAAHGAGKPVVAFSVGGISKQIDHGVNGLVAADRTPEGLAHEVLRLADDKQLLAKLQEGARASSGAGSTWASSAESVLSLCTSIIAETSKSSR
jgi:glycosyltransferase involved in cell wall biosynthesis